MRESLKERLKANIRKAQELQNEFAQCMMEALEAGINVDELEKEITKEILEETAESKRAKMEKL